MSVESSRTARLGDESNKEKYQPLYSFIPAIYMLANMWAFLDSSLSRRMYAVEWKGKGLEFVNEAIEIRLIAR